MRDWIPVPGTAKARLVDAAVHQFEAAGYQDANVAELASKAGVTTGSLYHHFGSKLGLYLVVRDEMERRVTERMAGAAAVSEGPRAPLLVAFDTATRFQVCRILAEPVPVSRPDAIAEALRPLAPSEVTATVLAAAWRSALLAVAGNTLAEQARAALEFLVPNR